MLDPLFQKACFFVYCCIHQLFATLFLLTLNGALSNLDVKVLLRFYYLNNLYIGFVYTAIQEKS